MTNPEMMHLISAIPEPAAYLAKAWTRRAATKDSAAYWGRFRQPVYNQEMKEGVVCGSAGREEGEKRNNVAPQTAHI